MNFRSSGYTPIDKMWVTKIGAAFAAMFLVVSVIALLNDSKPSRVFRHPIDEVEELFQTLYRHRWAPQDSSGRGAPDESPSKKLCKGDPCGNWRWNSVPDSPVGSSVCNRKDGGETGLCSDENYDNHALVESGNGRYV